jgi:hypothetical protein
MLGFAPHDSFTRLGYGAPVRWVLLLTTAPIWVAAVLVSGGCSSSSESVLTAGYDGARGHRSSPSPAAAAASARQVEQRWRRELTRRARAQQDQVFKNPTAARLRQELRRAARRYDFEVVSVLLLRPQQIVPRIVVRTKHYVELARATPTILSRVDPRSPARDDAKGWKYEGFYFEARDEHNVPFLIAFNFWRGPSGGGGQWARSEPLYPFQHS